MKTNIDFANIRSYKGSQHNAFEELVCQLARLSPPDNAKSFIRKDGSSGDAGVECCWMLEDGSEHAWQAKYFLQTIKSSQWRQISDSFETALNKHPKLKKYCICLPLNRTDQKQDNKESALDKWNKKTKEWKALAKSKNMNVEFEFWGESEIVSMLSMDNPRFSGRALYWFNSPVLRIQHLKDIAEKSKQSLGERFSPEFHIDLPIAKTFDGIGLTPNWRQRFHSAAEEWLKALKDLKKALADLRRDIISEEDKRLIEGLIEERGNPVEAHSIKLEALLKQTVKTCSLYENRNQLKDIIIHLKQNSKTKMDYTKTKTEQKINWHFNLFSDAALELSQFFLSKDMKVFSIKSMLLSGDAGAGKSHLLCDIALNRLKNDLPALFLLGQHYEGGDPLKFISASLDLKNISHQEILGALDALGEARSTRALIIIDAINEGPHKEQWQNYIENLILELAKYPHIALVFSCRSTYLQHLLPQINNSGKKQNEAKLTEVVKHQGFSNLNDIYKYLEKQGVFAPNMPIMDPEFSSPLFLKIYCKLLKAKGENKFFQGSKSIEEIFNFYVDSVSETVNRNKKYRPGEKVVSKALQAFALQLFPNNLYGLQTGKARKIIQEEDPSSDTGNLFNALLNEEFLSEDIALVPHKVSEGRHEHRKEHVVRFAYERFSDYFIAKSLIEKEIRKKPKKAKKIISQIKCFFYKMASRECCLNSENLKSYFKKGSALGSIFFSNQLGAFNGIIEALFIRIGDDFKVELYDLVEIENKEYLLEETLKKSFLWRSPDSFTHKTFKLLSQLSPIYFHSPMLEVLLKLSVKPEHPWNADFLHKILIDKTMPERDRFWSTHVFFSYHNKDPTIKKLIDWPYSSYFENISSEHARLYAIVLIWLTASSHRELRDRATKAAIIILSKYPEHLLELMNRFSKVNDLYVRERLYAAAYGAAVNIEDKSLIKKIAEKTYEQVFKDGKPAPHILLRDYARCILEFAYKQKLLSNEIDPESFRPPYKSAWPIENPMDSEIDALADSKKFGSAHYSLMGFSGDFGIYTMSCVHYFSPTPLTEKRPETGAELQKKFKEKNRFAETLNERQREKKRWLFDDRFMGGSPAAFSRKWAKRWVCKQVYEMGWSGELFEEFDKKALSLRRTGGESLSVERIGKKYQWIAFHKLLAHLADNVHYTGGYDGESKYKGPWQLRQRDIDPTCYLRRTGAGRNLKNASNCWWQPSYAYNFPEESLEKQKEWLKSKNIDIPFKKSIQAADPTDGSLWTALHSFSLKEKKISPYKTGERLYDLEIWFRTSAIIVSKKDRDVLCEKLKNKDLRNSDITAGWGMGDRFLKEYPVCDEKYDDKGWKDELSGNHAILDIKHLRLYTEYTWEAGNTDYSIDETISFYLPSKTLIDKLNLKCPSGQFENWINDNNMSVFKDPGVKSKGPSCPLAKTDILASWLNKDNLCLAWLIGGEKRLYKNRESGKLHGFSGIYFANGAKIEGDMWFLGISEWGEDF